MSDDSSPIPSFAERWRRSQDVTTTSKVASVDAYWRCAACGEVWNVARHRAGSRYARDLPFRR